MLADVAVAPVTVVPVHVPHDGIGLTLYRMIGDPWLAGSTQLTVANPPMPAVAVTDVGGAGAVTLG